MSTGRLFLYVYEAICTHALYLQHTVPPTYDNTGPMYIGSIHNASILVCTARHTYTRPVPQITTVGLFCKRAI